MYKWLDSAGVPAVLVDAITSHRTRAADLARNERLRGCCCWIGARWPAHKPPFVDVQRGVGEARQQGLLLGHRHVLRAGVVKLMHQYRIYTFREDGHFSTVQRICTDEKQAVQKAQVPYALETD